MFLDPKVETGFAKKSAGLNFGISAPVEYIGGYPPPKVPLPSFSQSWIPGLEEIHGGSQVGLRVGLGSLMSGN